MAMLTAFLDESGGVDTQLLVIAGYVGVTEAWVLFAKEWTSILKLFGLSAFHMKEFAHRTGEFTAWSEEKRVKLLSLLIELIKASPVFPVSSSVPIKDYNEVLLRRAPKMIRDPYFHCFPDCVVQTAKRVAKLVPGSKVDFIFDAKNELAARAGLLYGLIQRSTYIPEEYRLIMAAIAMGDDVAIVPLQAADLLAYEINKWRRGFMRTPMTLLDEIHGTHYSWTREKLENMVLHLDKASENENQS